jgi:hypothetical protein
MKRLQPGSYRTVPGDLYGTPKELWGFSLPAEGSASAAAARFLKLHDELLGHRGIKLVEDERSPLFGLGATHVIWQQEYKGIPVHRAYVTVHVSRRGRLYLAKNRAIPRRLLGGEPRFAIGKQRAVELALESAKLDPSRAEIVSVKKRWYPLRQELAPAWRVRVHKPRAPAQSWIVHVNATSGAILSQWDNVAWARPVGWLFDPNPVIALGSHRRLLRSDGTVRPPPARAYAKVFLRDLLDGVSSLDGKRATTVLTKRRIDRSGGTLRFLHAEPGLAEVMAYHHVDRALAHLEKLGYRDERRIFKTPIQINTRATGRDESWYDPFSQTLSFGYGAVPDAEDGETILHELGHAIQDAICPGFGQSPQAAAMGEGFGDYLAASFFSHKKRGRYRAAVMCWDGIVFDDHDPPCVRRVDGDKKRQDFAERGKVHDNGELWSAVLWDLFNALENRTVADRLILDSHFQLDPLTGLDAGARAILDADRNLYAGRHLTLLKKVFENRGFQEF